MLPSAQCQLAFLPLDNGEQVPVIRLLSACTPHGLEFAPTADEMAELGAELIRLADDMKTRAADQASAEIKKAWSR